MTRSAVTTRSSRGVELPSEVSSEVGFFDRFAGGAAGLAAAPRSSRSVCCWCWSGSSRDRSLSWSTRSFSQFLDATYQLEINTTTTIITFLMVALLQNSQTRENQATQHKLNSLADVGLESREHHPQRQVAARQLQ